LWETLRFGRSKEEDYREYESVGYIQVILDAGVISGVPRTGVRG